jgi:two-component system sensor histidine kinase KdpD
MDQRGRTVALAAVEALAAVALATGLVALLDLAAPVAGLGVVYLLAVLLLAIRRGELAALATALLSVLALNYFFIAPVHRLTISESENVVALGVLLIAALVVGRLASASRERAAEADERARVAAARERDATMLAAAASSVLEGTGLDAQLENIERSLAAGGEGQRVRVELSPVPSAGEGELVVRLGAQLRSGWLYAPAGAGWERSDLKRIGDALGRLIDVALERDRVAAQAAETEAARRADVLKTAVLHAISHDLRSPLTAITTAAGGLAAGAVGERDRRELVAVIEDEAARLSRLIDDLLDLSRIEAGALDRREDWCDLHDVVGSAVRQARARHADVVVDVQLPAELPLVRADGAQLERVFANLIDNAVRHTPPGTRVRVTGGAGSGLVTVRVIDRGRGVPQGQRAQIFEPFFRGRAKGGGGSGLGLAICRGFVQANGGRIVLQSGTPGETTFAVSFPLVAQPAPVA